jgi:hypothetical protein
MSAKEAADEQTSTGFHLAPRQERGETQRHNQMYLNYAEKILEDQKARGAIDMASTGWRDTIKKAKLELGINVKGPRGVKVGASVDGDFQPDPNRGVDIQRSFTNQQ